MIDKHTPTPWEWGDGDYRWRLLGRIHGQSVILEPANHPDAEDGEVSPCLMLRAGYDMVLFDKDHPDARFMLLAVNHHAAMVEMLERCGEWVHSDLCGRKCHALHNDLDALLARVRGETQQ